MTNPKNLSRDEWLAKAGLLTEALPYMRRYTGKTVVVKYGGHAMGDDKLAQLFARDIVLLKQVGINPVVVHGGGPQIAAMLDRLKMKSKFVDGLRVTDRDMVGIVEMVLSGQINKRIVADIASAGGRAIGLSGKDGDLLRARKIRSQTKQTDSNIEKVLDLGFVGEPAAIDPHVIQLLKGTQFIPVIAPIGTDAKGQTFNINADTVAGAIAGALGATRLLMLTDIEGVLDSNSKLISELNLSGARKLLRNGTISGGMIPKVKTCITAIKEGVEAVAILDGRVPHAVLLEIFTEHGSGTLIRGKK